MPAAQGGTPPRPLQVLLVSDSPADLVEVHPRTEPLPNASLRASCR